MGLFPDWLPWLDKQAALREAGRLIIASGAATNALTGFAATGARSSQLMPTRRDRDHLRAIEQQLSLGTIDGPPDSLDRSLELLLRRAGTVLPGTFVFVLSDFLPPPLTSLLRDAVVAGWDVVPVVVQDPVWEQSFPDLAGVTLPLVHPDGGAPMLVRLRRKEAHERREANERRSVRLREALLGLDLVPVSITSSNRAEIHAAFSRWAEGRRRRSRIA